MMKTDSNLPQRASIRLPGYDYTQPGAYFITLCTQGREALFGEIVSGEMRLSAAGRIAAAEWRRLERQFPGIRVDAFVVMPNHVHGILVIEDVGATRRGPIETRMGEGGSPVPGQDAGVGATRRGQDEARMGEGGSPVPGQDAGVGATPNVGATRHVPEGMPHGKENGKTDTRSGEGGSPVEMQTNQSLRATVDRPTRATLDNENETISGANMGQPDSGIDQYGSPLRDASDVGATRRGQINTPGGEGGSPEATPNNQSLRSTVDRPTRATQYAEDSFQIPGARATLDNENETISGANMGQNNSLTDQYGSPLQDASDVGATRRGQINTPGGEAGSPVPGQDAARMGEAGSPVGDRPNGPAAGSLGAIIGQFKSRATRRIWAMAEYGRAPVWQRNYYEHIIRSEAEWGKIADYIENNPRRWDEDQLNPKAPENPFTQGKTHGE